MSRKLRVHVTVAVMPDGTVNITIEPPPGYGARVDRNAAIKARK
jgi:hypothetical protein